MDTISNIPIGHRIVIDHSTGRQSLRPVAGYSEKYLTKNTFIPKCSVGTIHNVLGAGQRISLDRARSRKNDEFYTRLEDIESEMHNYEPHFRNAVIYCPCDNLYNMGRSNFGTYFISNFHRLGIRKIIFTQYNPNGLGILNEDDVETRGRKWEYTGSAPDGTFVDESEIDVTFLRGNGSFDSRECREIMKECDIVITNPPFSLFRKFMSQIMGLGKKFIILGNMNALSYKEVFPYIMENKMWLGCRHLGSNMYFGITDEYKEIVVREKKEGLGWKVINGEVFGRVGNACWFTNLEHGDRNRPLRLDAKYDESRYPRYDNYDAIEVSKISDIPVDYEGVMAVPITFLGKYCPRQFEILGIMQRNDDPFKTKYYTTEEYPNANNLNTRGVIIVNGVPKAMYARILIRRIS